MRRLLSSIVALALLTLAGCSVPITGPASPSPDVPAPAPVAAAPDLANPVEIAIPALDVRDDVISVGLNDAGALEVPPVEQTGWYSGSPLPGETGPALISGHVNWDGQPGALARIGELKAGDRIEVTAASGATATFDVYKVDEQHKTGIDWVSVLADRPTPELVVVTCSGRLIGHSYEDNTIVSARMVTT